MNNVHIADTFGADDGGAICNSGTLTLHACTFNNNQAFREGGAIYNSGTLTMTNCHFDKNEANNYNQAQPMGQGGAVYNAGILTMSDCEFSTDIAAVSGGAVFNANQMNVYDCTFTYDQAGYGGAIYNKGSLWVLDSFNQFTSNKAITGAGGAIYNGGSATVVNAFFSDNTTAASGGAIANFGNIYVGQDTVFYGNHANYYGGGFYDGLGSTWNMSWTASSGNTAGVKGPLYYNAPTGRAGSARTLATRRAGRHKPPGSAAASPSRIGQL